MDKRTKWLKPQVIKLNLKLTFGGDANGTEDSTTVKLS